MFVPNKKISVFPVTGLKILGRVGTHILFLFFFKYNFMHLEGISPFKMDKIICFSRKHEKKI